MQTERKKELAAAYKDKKDVGGVHLIENKRNGKALLLPTPNAAGAESRFAFARMTGSCVHPRLQAEWGGGEDFTITLLDTLDKEPEWDNRRFREELDALAALWRERLGQRDWY